MALLMSILISAALGSSSDCIDRENDPTGEDYRGDVNYYNHPEYGKLVSA